MTTETIEMVTSSITSSSSPCRIAAPPSRCTRRMPYLLRSTLQRVQAESLLPGVTRRALQVAQSSDSEALFQLGALQTTAATPLDIPVDRSRLNRRPGQREELAGLNTIAPESQRLINASVHRKCRTPWRSRSTTRAACVPSARDSLASQRWTLLCSSTKQVASQQYDPFSHVQCRRAITGPSSRILVSSDVKRSCAITPNPNGTSSCTRTIPRSK
jgi:hypothetical protein